MVFKRGVTLLLVAAAVAVAAEKPIEVETNLKNPVVKDVKTVHGKLVLTVEEGGKKHHSKTASAHIKSPVKAEEDDEEGEEGNEEDSEDDLKKSKKHAKETDEDEEGDEADDEEDDVKKIVKKKAFRVKVMTKKDVHKTKSAHIKSPVKEAEDEEEGDEADDDSSDEVVRKYAHGQVRLITKSQPAPKKAHKKSHHKTITKSQAAPKKHNKTITKSQAAPHKQATPNNGTAPNNSTAKANTTTTDVNLAVGESVSLEFGGHNVDLELLKNGSLKLSADKQTYILPNVSDVTIDVDADADDPNASVDMDVDVFDRAADGSQGGSAAAATTPSVGDANEPKSFLKSVETEASDIAKSFTEFATKVTGDGKFFSKEAAPFVFVAGCVGILGLIIGIAALAVTRTRATLAADPASVLSEATEDLDEDVEAAVAEKKEDEEAKDADALDSSDSESSDDENEEEGKFTNGATVSV